MKKAKAAKAKRSGAKRACGMTCLLLIIACLVLSLQAYIIAHGASQHPNRPVVMEDDYLAKMFEEEEEESEDKFSEEDRIAQQSSFDKAIAKANEMKNKIKRENQAERELERASNLRKAAEERKERERRSEERERARERERDRKHAERDAYEQRKRERERERRSAEREAEEQRRERERDRKHAEREAEEQRKRHRELERKRAEAFDAKQRAEDAKRAAEEQRALMRKTKKLTRHKNIYKLVARPHPMLKRLCQQNYPFQPCRTNRGQLVNIIFVRAPMGSGAHKLYQKYKNDILFIGISSFEDYPLPPENPFSQKFPSDLYVGLFPGFLHMMHPEQAKKVFPPHVKLLLMSQSDFSLPYPTSPYPKKQYDFALSGSDQDVANDCVGWSSFAKNWSFVKKSLAVMCGEYNMTGVLVATKNKAGTKACTIPKACKGKMLQTTFLPQYKYFWYLQRSHFAYLPQIHDASPRVSSQALALNVPVLMNKNIMGGWKYVNKKTGEFFHDMSNFRESLERIMKNAKIPGHYTPRDWVMKHYGDSNSGPRLFKWIVENFSDRVKLPPGTTALSPSGA